LAGFRRRDLGSQEAALKYFLLGAFASGFLVYGAALLFGGSGTTHLEGIKQAAADASGAGRVALLAGMGLLSIGLAFKVALVPFHMWTPDVYEGAPTSVAAFMSVAAKAAGFAALVRVFVYGLSPLAGAWVPLLVVLAALTMSVGNVVALAQTNLKRLLAYSSIAHAGYVVLGVVSGGSWGINSALFYLLAYTFSNLGAFAVVASMREGDRELLSLNQYAGLSSRRPLLAAAMTVFLLSLAGVPPTGGFLAKLYVLGAAVQSGQIALAVVAVANSAVAAFYYLRVILIMYMRPAPAVELKVTIAPSMALALLLAAWGTIQLGILPDSAIEIARQTFVAAFGP
ncbi:MAG: NADH-quinone oxidoreductase subunit N, partial [Anaerolineae bacterium]